MEEVKPTEEKTKSEESHKKKLNKDSLLIIFLVLLLIVCGMLGWWYKKATDENNKLEKSNNELQSKVTSLTQQVADKTKEAEDAKKSASTTTTPTVSVTVPSSALKENVAAAISSKNTAALEGYMAASVNVVYAASEKAGPRTPAQAVSDLDYLNAATSPWNFALSAATLITYKNGFYGQYFGTNTIVGKSANKYVVSFGVNSSNKIDTIFIGVSEDLLK